MSDEEDVLEEDGGYGGEPTPNPSMAVEKKFDDSNIEFEESSDDYD
jgi:hypothetical protein